MTPAETYRVKAAEFRAKAEQETHPSMRAELERLTQSYLRLAEQADHNARMDLVYETPPKRPSVQQQQQAPSSVDLPRAISESLRAVL